MKKWIIASGIMLMISGSIFAQQKGSLEKRSSDERILQMTERLTQELALNETQKTEILKLQKQHIEQRKSAIEKQKKERETHQSQIQGILTEEQRAKWVEMHNDRKAHLKGRSRGEIHARPRHGKRGSQGLN